MKLQGILGEGVVASRFVLPRPKGTPSRGGQLATGFVLPASGFRLPASDLPTPNP